MTQFENHIKKEQFVLFIRDKPSQHLMQIRL